MADPTDTAGPADQDRITGSAASERCSGCYDSFSGPWCDNCDTWPCKCVLPCEHGVPAYHCEDCNG